MIMTSYVPMNTQAYQYSMFDMLFVLCIIITLILNICEVICILLFYYTKQRFPAHTPCLPQILLPFLIFPNSVSFSQAFDLIRPMQSNQLSVQALYSLFTETLLPFRTLCFCLKPNPSILLNQSYPRQISPIGKFLIKYFSMYLFFVHCCQVI